MNQKMIMRIGLMVAGGVALYFIYKKYVKPKLDAGITKDAPKEVPAPKKTPSKK